MTSPAASRFPEVAALREVFSHQRNLVAYPPAAVGTGLTYALIQAWLSVGTPALWALRVLTPSEIMLSVGFGFLFPLLILLDVYLWRHPTCLIPKVGKRNEGVTTTAVVLSLLPNTLCCTPIIPTLLALFIGGGTLVSFSAPAQHTIAAIEPEIYLLSLLMLWFSIRLASRRLERAHLPQGEDPSPEADVPSSG